MADKKAAKEFVKRWRSILAEVPAGKNNEQQDTQKFWIDLLVNVLGVPAASVTGYVDFERKVRGRRIDVFVSDHHFLCEQKSSVSTLISPSRATAAWKRRCNRQFGTRGTCRTASAHDG